VKSETEITLSLTVWQQAKTINQEKEAHFKPARVVVRTKSEEKASR